MTLKDAFRQFDEVRDEYRGAGFALRHILRGYQNYPALNEAGSHAQVTLHHLEACEGNLQVTYFVRLFAEFETVLRDYWLNARKRTTAPPMAALMNSVAAYCFINEDDLLNANQVRDYRNQVMHDRLQEPEFDFQTCHFPASAFRPMAPAEVVIRCYGRAFDSGQVTILEP
jgi:hypothetical protein